MNAPTPLPLTVTVRVLNDSNPASSNIICTCLPPVLEVPGNAKITFQLENQSPFYVYFDLSNGCPIDGIGKNSNLSYDKKASSANAVVLKDSCAKKLDCSYIANVSWRAIPPSDRSVDASADDLGATATGQIKDNPAPSND